MLRCGCRGGERTRILEKQRNNVRQSPPPTQGIVERGEKVTARTRNLTLGRGNDERCNPHPDHRKPSNIILDHDGTVKILDLGIARFTPMPSETADDLTKTGCVLGTVDYMPPEQALNTRRADHRADIYSLGCTLYFLLTGQPVFGGDTVMERLFSSRSSQTFNPQSKSLVRPSSHLAAILRNCRFRCSLFRLVTPLQKERRLFVLFSGGE